MILSTEINFIQPEIEAIDGPNVLYRLIEDYHFQWQENGSNYRRTVFADGFTTDLASVPNFGKALNFQEGGPTDGASVLHDDEYQRLGRITGKGWTSGSFQILTSKGWQDCTEPFPRSRADELYRKMAILGGLPVWKANVEYAALRVGAYSYKNKLSWYLS